MSLVSEIDHFRFSDTLNVYPRPFYVSLPTSYLMKDCVMPADSVMMHVRLNKDLKANAENIADSFGLSLSGLVKVLLTGVINHKEIPKEFLTKKKYEDYLIENAEKSLSGRKISSQKSKSILGFDVEEFRKKTETVG